jgi:hypothetical protein
MGFQGPENREKYAESKMLQLLESNEEEFGNASA